MVNPVVAIEVHLQQHPHVVNVLETTFEDLKRDILACLGAPLLVLVVVHVDADLLELHDIPEIGRASCRERV